MEEEINTIVINNQIPNNYNNDQSSTTDYTRQVTLHEDISVVENNDVPEKPQIENKRQEMSISEYELMMSEKTFNRTKNDILFCLSADGSDSSNMAFDWLYYDYLHSCNEAYKLLIVYIYNNALDDTNNYYHRKKTVIKTYQQRMSKLSADNSIFLSHDRSSKFHAIDQVLSISAKYEPTYLVSGYYGIKGPKESTNELSKGIDYLLLYSKLPTIVIKEECKRKEGVGMKWLFVFDKTYINCTKLMKIFLPLVNPELDYVHGFTLLPSYVFYDDIKRVFEAEMEKHEIKNHGYESQEYKRNPGEIVLEKINFGEIPFNFSVIFNNPQKYKVEGENSDTLKIVKKGHCNICFLNGMA
jgi:hypothetical protein